MNNRRFIQRITIVSACLIFVSFAVVTVLVAQQPESSSETTANQASNPPIISYDSTTSTGFPPDENLSDNANAAQALSYYHVSGTTLRGRSSITEYALASKGCMYITSGIGDQAILNTELHLPQGAVIKYLRVDFYDGNTTSGVRGKLTRYKPGESSSDFFLGTGSTDAFADGYGFVVSNEITETVDNEIYAYTLIGWPDEANFDNQICGLRIAYYIPSKSTFLPTITK